MEGRCFWYFAVILLRQVLRMNSSDIQIGLHLTLLVQVSAEMLLRESKTKPPHLHPP